MSLADPVSRPNFLNSPRRAGIVAITILTLITLPCGAAPYKRWEFDKYNDRQGWTVPSSALGVVMGGSLWVTLNRKETDPDKIAAPLYQDHGDAGLVPDPGTEILSPRGIDIAAPSGQQIQVKIRILNLSPVTDLFIRWRTKDQLQDWGETGSDRRFLGFLDAPQSKHCAVMSSLNKWQEITCYVDKEWHEVIDQIAIYSPLAIRGDIWFSYIAITTGPIEPVRVRPDVASIAVVPKITVPGVSQLGFTAAFKVLDKCLIFDVPLFGFTHPFMSAGGTYNPLGWWLLDSSVTVAGAKWANEGFAEGVLEGFHDVEAENPDGRIDESGVSVVRGQVGDVSQPPIFFQVAYDVARRTKDLQLRSRIYHTMQRYLDWWLSPTKRDRNTGLISGVVDETFGEPEYLLREIMPQSVAPVGLNVDVAVAAARTAELASDLGKEEESKKYYQAFRDLSRAINDTLWDEQDGAYYSYDLQNHHMRRRLIVTTFDPLRLGIASAERRDRLLTRMLDPAQFNWGKLPLTSLAMTDPGYVEREGLNGDEAWNGGVWSYRNMGIIKGLEESGRPDLAAELNWATIKAFHNNYWEFLLPSSGRGGGVAGYGMSASQYIEAIVEHLFGVNVDRIRKRLRIEPHVPRALYGEEIALEDLIIPSEGNTRLAVRVKQIRAGAAHVVVNIEGPLPEGILEVALPGAGKKVEVPIQSSLMADFP